MIPLSSGLLLLSGWMIFTIVLSTRRRETGRDLRPSVLDHKDCDTALLESKKEAWNLIIKVLTVILAELNIMRVYGQAANLFDLPIRY